jgi:hypothetical protein
MATKRLPTGIDHFTVVPENFESASESESVSREECERGEE